MRDLSIKNGNKTKCLQPAHPSPERRGAWGEVKIPAHA